VDHDGVDAIEMEQVREQKPGGAGADDSDLRPRPVHSEKPLAVVTFAAVSVPPAADILTRRTWRRERQLAVAPAR
jgi:hypothetical protein